MKRGMSTGGHLTARDKCADCLPLWDRGGNVRGIQLCGLHTAAAAMRKALIALVEYWDHGTPVHAGADVVTEARAALAAANEK